VVVLIISWMMMQNGTNSIAFCFVDIKSQNFKFSWKDKLSYGNNFIA
jgi:hypothetical protein